MAAVVVVHRRAAVPATAQVSKFDTIIRDQIRRRQVPAAVSIDDAATCGTGIRANLSKTTDGVVMDSDWDTVVPVRDTDTRMHTIDDEMTVMAMTDDEDTVAMTDDEDTVAMTGDEAITMDVVIIVVDMVELVSGKAITTVGTSEEDAMTMIVDMNDAVIMRRIMKKVGDMGWESIWIMELFKFATCMQICEKVYFVKFAYFRIFR